MENEVKAVETTATTAPAQAATTDTAQAEQTVSKGKFTEFIESLFSGEPAPIKDDAKPKADPKADKPANDFETRLAEEKAKWEAEQTSKLELAKLPDADKAKAESEAQKAELAAVKQQLAERELKAEAVSYLEKEGYPVGLADMLIYSSKEAKDKTLEKTISIFQAAFESGINERLKGKIPAGLGGAKGSANQLQDQIARNIRGGIN